MISFYLNTGIPVMPDNLTIADAAGLDPLTFFYKRAELTPVIMEPVVGDEMPEPYKTLLVHDNDMTPTLEAYYKQRMYLYVLDQDRDAKTCAREVIMLGETSEKAVEFGAIYINLEHLPGQARALVAQGHKPFGAILAEFEIPHRSSPKSYCKIVADETIKGALQLEEDKVYELYGRSNQLLTEDGELLAEVVEVLPPAES
jgi:chorismate-pyruvate lyase